MPNACADPKATRTANANANAQLFIAAVNQLLASADPAGRWLGSRLCDWAITDARARTLGRFLGVGAVQGTHRTLPGRFAEIVVIDNDDEGSIVR